MAAKTILYSAIKPETLEFGEPVRDNQGITVPVQYEGRRLQFQLPKLRCAPSPPSGRSPAARRAAPGEPPHPPFCVRIWVAAQELLREPLEGRPP